ncbi:MAG TPA: MscL family protein [Gemmatimonadales bacterium]
MADQAPAVRMSFMDEFKKFMLETNALSLALGVVIGGAIAKLVSAITDGLIMPVISLVLPGGNWREWSIILKHGTPGPDCGVPGKVCVMVGEKALALGQVIGAVLDFAIIGLVVFIFATRIMKVEIKR